MHGASGRSAKSPPIKQIRYHATSMELAAYLDGRYVEMHIGTDTGQDIAVVCEKGSIFAIQRHIEQLGRECPEISTWQTGTSSDGGRADDQRSYEAAISEGWPVAPMGETSKLCAPIVEPA